MDANMQKTVMIVENSGIDRDILRVAIQKKYNVITAENGYTAKNILESGTEISIILLDAATSTMNEFDFLEWIQSIPKYHHIPIVFTSLAGTDENILKGLELGVRDVFIKPYDLGQIIRSIDNLLMLAQYQKNVTEEEVTNQELHTVLIVDDSLLSRKILIETLRNQFHFMEATNGIEALEILRTHKEEISLVLLDMIMPEMDGYEVMKIANAEKLVENIPVVAVTSDEGQDRYVRMLELGIHEVVKKPFSPLIVQGKFKNLIDLYRYGQFSESVITPPKQLEEKKLAFSTGIFHLQFNGAWECVFTSDSCLELLKCTKEEFLNTLSAWKVYKEITEEEISVSAVLEELSGVQKSCSYEGDITENDQSAQKVKCTYTSFLGSDSKMQLYGTMEDITYTHEEAETNLFFSENHPYQEQREKMLCRYIIRGRRAIINSLFAKQIGIHDEIENFPQWIVKNGYIAEEYKDEWYRVFDEIDGGKQQGSCEILFQSEDGEMPSRCLMEYTGMTDTDGKPSGALIYYEFVIGETKKTKKKSYRGSNTSASMKHFYEIASINLTKGTCHIVHNGGGNQKSYAQDILLSQILQETYQSVAPEYQDSFKKTFSREAQLAAIAKGQDEYSFTYLRRSKDNSWIWVETVATRQYNPYDDDILVCIVSRMVDEHKVQEQLLLRTLRNSVEKKEGWEQYEGLSSRIFHGMVYADYDDARPSQYAIGTLANELGCIPYELALATSTNIPKEDRENFQINRKDALRKKEEIFISHYRIKTLYGTWIWVSNTATRFRDKEGNEGYIYFLVDSTYEQTLNEQLRVQKKEVATLRKYVQTDQLSGTYSREYFMEKAQEMIEENTKDLYIVRLNIAHFKVINELEGIEKCDRLLWKIGQHLKKQGQEEGFIVGRFFADRFYLCIRKEQFERIDLVNKVSLPGLSMEINLIYGVCPVEENTSVHVMCDRADMALKAKGTEDAEYIHYYSDEFHQKLMQIREIESEMETALAERQFCIYVQPKFDIDQEQVVGGEVLVRWKHPEKGLIPPGIFINVFEKNGFIRELDYFVWEESCRFLAEAKEKGLPRYPLSVNVSRIHFYSNVLQQKWMNLLEKYHLEARDIELEVTESICDENPKMIINQCRQLRNLGFRISMDDFGSGYSSLNMLRKLPLDILKMDLKFLEEDGSQEEKMKGRDILRTQIELAHTIGLDVVVEGLETKEQKNFIKEIGSCAAQGYFYARPMPAHEYAEMIQDRTEDSGRVIPSEMAARLRRERLRKEQLHPLLEVISASKTIFGYLLPEKVGILSREMAENLNCSQRISNLEERFASSGVLTFSSVPQFAELLKLIDSGERSGATIVESNNAIGDTEPYWVRFDTVLDYEGNPLIAMFTVEKFGNITSQVMKLIRSKQSLAETENLQLKEQAMIIE